MKIPDMTINKLNHNFIATVKVKITKEFHIRMKIAAFLFWLGAQVLGCKIKIECGDDDSQDKQNDRPETIDYPYMIHGV
jgi:hypothetical protein